MSLPSGQQHALDGIQGGLCRSDPQLASKFAVFTQLTKLDQMPAIEQLSHGRLRLARGWQCSAQLRARALGRLRPIVLVPLVLLAAASLLIMSFFTIPRAGQRRCPQTTSLMVAGPLHLRASCAKGSSQPTVSRR